MPIQSQVLTASHNKQKTVSWRNQNTVFSLSYSLIKVNSTSADIQKLIWGGGAYTKELVHA